MGKKAFSTTMDGETLKALKLYAVKQDRALNDVLEEAAVAYLAQKATEDPDATIFIRRSHEPLEDCLAAIEQRISSIKKRRA
jgi:sirohydrochlorin ferrochelatase